jgi:hypothetical protein
MAQTELLSACLVEVCLQRLYEDVLSRSSLLRSELLNRTYVLLSILTVNATGFSGSPGVARPFSRLRLRSLGAGWLHQLLRCHDAARTMRETVVFDNLRSLCAGGLI